MRQDKKKMLSMFLVNEEGNISDNRNQQMNFYEIHITFKCKNSTYYFQVFLKIHLFAIYPTLLIFNTWRTIKE